MINALTLILMTLWLGVLVVGIGQLARRRWVWGAVLAIEATLVVAAQAALSLIPVGIGNPLIRITQRGFLTCSVLALVVTLLLAVLVFGRKRRQTASVSKTDAVSTDAVYRFVATELEICPSAQGYAHAMQVGYGLQPDLLHALLALLDGRELIFVSTQQWSEFIWEQLAFCKAVTEAGGRARVWLDVPIQTLATQLQRGERWVPPMFGVSDKPDNWDDNMLRRIRTHGLDSFLIQDLPEDHTDVVAFRFGYLDCFAPEFLDRLQKWEHGGATFLNPTSFLWDSKVLMAALRLPSVREQISKPPRSRAVLDVLDACIPETHLLTPHTMRHFIDTRDQWVLKFAGFDSGQQAWGGRSLQVGARHTDTSWRDILQHYLDLPFPVVAQRSAPSAILNIDYLDEQDQVQRLLNGRTRLRSFMLRGAGALGSHLTVVGGVGGVSEGTGAVQMPIHFAK